MYSLIDLKDQSQADYLNSALRRHGLDAFVLGNGLAPDGRAVFSIACLNASELAQARWLIYSCPRFIGDLHPEAAMLIRELRAQNHGLVAGLLLSRPVRWIAGLALAGAVLGYLLDL